MEVKEEEEENPTTQSSELEEEEEEKLRNRNPCRIEDHHVLQFLDSAEDYITLMDSLSLILRQGWFELASARHSMGVSRVNGTLLDLKPRSAPTSLRIVNQGDDASEARFSLHKWSSSVDGPRERKSDSEEDKLSNISQLRRRGGASQVSEETAPQNDAPLVADDQVQKERLKSLSVFGTLVSPKLRNAQLSFETALEKIVEIANARSKMLAGFHQVKGGVEGTNGSTKI